MIKKSNAKCGPKIAILRVDRTILVLNIKIHKNKWKLAVTQGTYATKENIKKTHTTPETSFSGLRIGKVWGQARWGGLL